jgi:PKD repeat protein
LADTVNVSLTVTTSQGCVDSLTQQLIITEPPFASFTNNQVSSCGMQLITFYNTSISQYTNFNWDFGNGVTSTDLNPLPVSFDIGNSVDTSFVVVLSASNLCGTDSFQDTINLFSFPSPDFAFYPQTACSGVPVSFSNISFGYNLSYEWFINGSLISTNTNPLPYNFTANIVDSVYNITLSAANLCDTSSITLPITVYPPDVYPFFTVDSSFACMGQTVFFNSAVPSYNYIIWRYGDGPNSVDTLPYHTYTNPGTYTVWQVVYGFCGIDSISRQVTIFPNPEPLFNFANPICGRDSAVFNNLSPGNNNFYFWNFGDGEFSSSFSPAHLYDLPGNSTTIFNVTLTVTSASTLCKDSLTLPITVLYNPIAEFSIQDNEVCLGSSISLAATTSPGLNYEWTLSDGTIYLGSQINHLFQDTGTYSFVLRVNDSNQCWDDTSYSLLFVRPNAVSEFSFNQIPPCASSAQVVFTNLSSQSNNYTWNFNGQGTSNLETPIPLNFTAPTVFNTTLIANNSFNCPDTTIKEIQVVIKPVAGIITPDRVCVGEEFSLIHNSVYGESVIWHLDGSIIANSDTYQLTHDTPEVVNISLTVYSAFDSTCFDTDTATIIVDKMPMATFTVNSIDTIIDGIAISPCAGYFSFIPDFDSTDKLFWWEFGNGTTSNNLYPTIFYDDNGQYPISLQVENIYGCKNSSTQLVDVLCDGLLVLPNALAPSSNEIEIARFIPKGKNIETLKIEIFSPWGERVWYTDKLDQEGRPTDYWDGKYRDKDLPQGAYLVKVRATFSSKSPLDKMFYLTLLR